MSRRLRGWLIAAVMLLALVGAGHAWAQGCAMCQASLPGSEDPLSHGFNYSIYMFLGVTYGLIAGLGGFIGYKYWRARAPRAATRVLVFQRFRKEEQS